MVLVLNDVTPRTEDAHIFRSLKKKFEKYNYLTIAENMLELDSLPSDKLEHKDVTSPKKFQYFTRKSKGTAATSATE